MHPPSRQEASATKSNSFGSASCGRLSSCNRAMRSLKQSAKARESALGYSFALEVLKCPSASRPSSGVSGLTTSLSSQRSNAEGNAPLLYNSIVGFTPAAPKRHWWMVTRRKGTPPRSKRRKMPLLQIDGSSASYGMAGCSRAAEPEW